MGDQCTRFLDQLQVYLDNECGPDLHAKVEQHLADCPPCGDRADFEARLRHIIASSCKKSAPPGLMDNVMANLNLRS